jgi:hypothetical protein
MTTTRRYLLALAAAAALAVGLAAPAVSDAGAVDTTAVTAGAGQAVDVRLAGGDAAVDDSPEGAEDAETDVGAAASGGFNYGGPIKRAKVIERAKHWFSKNVPYNQGASHYDKNRGKKYRTDCSGFVSMAWGLKKSRVTWTLDEVSKQISYDKLKAGDILLIQHQHVMLFHKWANDGRTAFWIYELGSTATDMNHKKVTVSDAKGRGYKPWRYKDIRPN